MRVTQRSSLFAVCGLYGLQCVSASPGAPTSYCVKNLAPIGSGPRQEHSVVAAGSKIYIVGGLTTDSVTSSVEAYDTINNSWSAVAPLPLTVHHSNVASVDGKLYYLGGLASNMSDILFSKPSPKSYRFDPAQNKWDEIATMPSPRGSAAVGVHGQTIYLAGGLSTLFGAESLLSSYDTVTNKWTAYPALSLPEARDHAGGAVVDGVFYVLGGRVGNPGLNRATVYALKLNSSSAGWTTVAEMPGPRGGIAAAAVGNLIYTFGGEGNPAHAKGVFPDFAIYDTVKNSWETAPPMSVPRHGFGAAAIGNNVYVPGGGALMGGGEAVTVNEVYGPC